MITAADVATVLGSVAAALGTAGGVLRYVTKIAVSVESAAATGRSIATTLERHMEQEEALHTHLTATVAEHAVQLAVLQTRLAVPVAPPAPAAPPPGGGG